MSREISVGRIRDEAGVALVYALLAVLILGGLAVLFMARAVTESRATGREQRFETAVHVAEAGVDDVIEWTNKDFSYVTRLEDTGSGDPYWLSTEPSDANGSEHEFTLDLDASADDQRDWAIEIALNECDLSLAQTDVGEACGIRPYKDGAAMPWIFGVGFVPDHQNPTSVRVVKAEIAEGQASPQKAIVTNGPISEFNITICGVVRDVHSNGDLLVKGQANTVTRPAETDCPEEGSGDVTSTGTYSEEGNPDIGPGSGQVNRTERVPFVSALDVYRDFAAANSDPPAVDNWYDLCPDGTVRWPAFTAGGDPAPCTGEVRWPKAELANNWRGWRPETSAEVKLDAINDPKFLCSDCWRAGGGQAALQDGIYYVHENNALIQGDIGGNAEVTILTSATGGVSPKPQSGGSCANDVNNALNGNLGTFGFGSGDNDLRPFRGNGNADGAEWGDLLFLAERDIAMQGNLSGADLHGVLAAHEQIHGKGSPKIKGALFSEDACENATNPGSSPHSPVHNNVFTGSVEITHAVQLLTPFFDLTHITAWTELR